MYDVIKTFSHQNGIQYLKTSYTKRKSWDIEETGSKKKETDICCLRQVWRPLKFWWGSMEQFHDFDFFFIFNVWLILFNDIHKSSDKKYL